MESGEWRVASEEGKEVASRWSPVASEELTNDELRTTNNELRTTNVRFHHIFVDNWGRVINSTGTVVEIVDLNNCRGDLRIAQKITDWWDDDVHPTDIGMDGEGRIYVLDAVANMVKIYQADGSLEKEISLAKGFSAGHIEVMEDGSMIVGGLKNYSAYYDSEGKFKNYIVPGNWMRMDEDGWLYSEKRGGISVYGPNVGGLKLEDGKYEFRVICEDGKGGLAVGETSVEVNNTVPIAVCPEDSTGVVDLTPPFPVANFKAVPHSGSVDLSWINPPDWDLCGVRIRRSPVHQVTMSPDEDNQNLLTGDLVTCDLVTSFRDTNVQNGVTYTYTIQAYDEVPNYSAARTAEAMPREWGSGEWRVESGEWGGKIAGVKDAAAFDYDGDGIPEMFVVGDRNMLLKKAADEWVEVNGVWSDDSGECVCAIDYDGDKDLDIFVGTEGQSVIYKNVTSAPGHQSPVWERITGPGAGIRKVVVRDFDRDDDLDLAVISDTENGSRITIFKNGGAGNFTESEWGSGIDDKINGVLPVSWLTDYQVCQLADYDNDGKLEVFVGADMGIKVYERRGTSHTSQVTSEGEEFIDVTGEVFASQPYGTIKQMEFFDYDHDGDLDLYVVTDGSNVFYENDCTDLKRDYTDLCGVAAFIDRTDDFGLACNEETIKALIFDYDKDGDRDIITFNKGISRVYINNCDNKNYIETALRGQPKGKNYFAIGNEVQLTDKLTGLGQRQVVTDSLPLHFGIGVENGK